MERHSLPGIYIAFEGIDGAGTTTHSKLAATVLRKLGYCTLWVSEPGSKLTIQAIRSVLSEAEPDQRLLTLLFAADRLNQVKMVAGALEKGCIVVSDRSVISSVAYQALHGGLSVEWVLCVNRFALLPDVIVYLDVDPHIAARRLTRRKGREAFERLAVLRQLYSVYRDALRIAEQLGAVTVSVEATPDGVEMPVEYVLRRTINYILAAIYTRKSLATKPPPQRDM